MHIRAHSIEGHPHDPSFLKLPRPRARRVCGASPPSGPAPRRCAPAGPVQGQCRASAGLVQGQAWLHHVFIHRHKFADRCMSYATPRETCHMSYTEACILQTGRFTAARMRMPLCKSRRLLRLWVHAFCNATSTSEHIGKGALTMASGC